MGVGDVSGGVTLADAARAKPVAKESVGSNEPPVRNPELAFPLAPLRSSALPLSAAGRGGASAARTGPP